jgi:hypothetical protein
LPKVKLVARDKRMFVASASHLWELKLNDLVYQVCDGSIASISPSYYT